VLEFNCRFGDPETQPILCRLQSDLVVLILKACEGRLEHADAVWDRRTAVGVVMASGGYPGPYEKAKRIDGLPPDNAGPVKVFHAGTALQRGQVVTDGGRVLCVVGLGEDVAEARDHAYRTVRRIHWDGAFYRSDIGHRALGRASAGR